jgi:large subunit ribosomal protein L9
MHMARNVEVLLREHVKDLGRCGDVVKVSPGYARNFLLPRQIAMQATDDNKKAMAKRRVVLDAVEAKRTAEFEALVASLNGIQLQTSAKADDQGHLFGSVSAAQIVELLQKMGHTFEEKAVRLDTPIKTVGTHPVKLHVHGDLHAEILVVVAAEGA